MSAFWSAWISVITLAVILGCTWLLFATRKGQKYNETTDKTVGHAFDGIEELDNPLPSWWFKMFVATVIFGLVYLLLYPGLGNFKGLLGWTSQGQWEEEMAYAEQNYAPVFARFAELSVDDLLQPENAEGLRIGQRLFANNCSVCHGVGGVGAYGFPNLTDDDWLYGGHEAAIKTSITNGRNGAMPAWGDVLGEDGIRDMAHFVLSLSNAEHDAESAARAQPQFGALCAACHMPDGTGMHALGAPNLTNGIWLYGGSFEQIAQTLRHGRFGVMPAFNGLLSEDQIHLITAYVKSLSN
ncbi:cytochrome-c oxidase, cbb3-type subunit III [Nitrincola tapanii]|uniref:Cbb3-type cytochrome c oxidase subunit n=1 Tax=Nitrincola tapanii TaxID=1708751 RepID=A0A5A9W6I7_9GAMM|nr:cytochrome-c oxidase, cbb3-type subunit III [Nitrincola tapanii]KAA0875815.1 cytochrome-c oxidase, cbb3-type subunit III [Nitrincola tapanii]